MKKKIMLPVLFLAMAPKVMAQCDAPVDLPYFEDVESVFTPSLPMCMTTMWESFASQEVFESSGIPLPGFSGNVLAYDTAINSEFIPADAWVSARLMTPAFEMVQGTAYKVSFRYANSDAGSTIGTLGIYLRGNDGAQTEIGTLENITGATATNYDSVEFTPPSTGVYTVDFSVMTEGTQGQLYLDDIAVRSTGIMGTNHETLSGLTLFPNPASGVVNISNAGTIDSIALYNSTGQLLLTQKPDTTTTAINMEGLPAGLYIVDVRSGTQIKKLKVIRE